MEITKKNLHQAIAALRRCAKENKGKQTDTGCIVVSDFCLDVADYLEKPAASVWHDANILPSNPKAAIVEHNEYSTSICRAEQMSRIKGAKWAYVEDLLKL